jgi:hypothetical protein
MRGRFCRILFIYPFRLWRFGALHPLAAARPPANDNAKNLRALNPLVTPGEKRYLRRAWLAARLDFPLRLFL